MLMRILHTVQKDMWMYGMQGHSLRVRPTCTVARSSGLHWGKCARRIALFGWPRKQKIGGVSGKVEIQLKVVVGWIVGCRWDHERSVVLNENSMYWRGSNV